MNTAWFSAAGLLLGWVASCIWTIYNARSSAANALLSAKMTEQLADFERRISVHYVKETVCRERMGLPPVVVVPS